MGTNAPVHIFMGSKSDLPVAEKCTKVLKELEIDYAITVCSAHRTPNDLHDYVKDSSASVFIAIAGLSAALPGAVASHTLKPVIGVPVSGKVNMDSILSIVQMPPGIPVGGVGLDRGDNAALLAAQILGTSDERVLQNLQNHRAKMADKVRADSASIQE